MEKTAQAKKIQIEKKEEMVHNMIRNDSEYNSLEAK